jgi:chromosome partitioning protein
MRGHGGHAAVNVVTDSSCKVLGASLSMPVIAVINRKGGSGKSTLATQLAGCLANRGVQVMLGDVDRQQSSLAWLRRRASQPMAKSATIVGSAFGSQSVMRPPANIAHVVLDTPGGLQGFDMARMAMTADAILMPVGDAVFDRESAVQCYAELMKLPRVVNGRCKIGVVGMRLEPGIKAAARMQQWAEQHGLCYVGSLRESRIYKRCAEQGLSLFDVPAANVENHLAQWRPIVEWVDATWAAAQRMESGAKAALPVSAPSISPHARRRTLVRAPLPVPLSKSGPASEFRMSRISREKTRPPRTERFGWLFTVFRAWA